MIIATGEDDISWRRGFVVCLPARPTAAQLIRQAKVREGSYAAQIVTSLYDRLFRWSLDLGADYARYYRLEYESFEEYLAKRLNFDEDVCSAIAAQEPRGSVMIHATPGFAFLDDENGDELLSALLEPRRTT